MRSVVQGDDRAYRRVALLGQRYYHDEQVWGVIVLVMNGRNHKRRGQGRGPGRCPPPRGLACAAALVRCQNLFSVWLRVDRASRRNSNVRNPIMIMGA